MISACAISRIDPKHCKLPFWMPPVLQFRQTKFFLDIQTIPSLPFNGIFNGFYRNDPPPIFVMSLENQRHSNTASKVAVSDPSEAAIRIPVF